MNTQKQISYKETKDSLNLMAMMLHQMSRFFMQSNQLRTATTLNMVASQISKLEMIAEGLRTDNPARFTERMKAKIERMKQHCQGHIDDSMKKDMIRKTIEYRTNLVVTNMIEAVLFDGMNLGRLGDFIISVPDVNPMAGLEVGQWVSLTEDVVCWYHADGSVGTIKESGEMAQVALINDDGIYVDFKDSKLGTLLPKLSPHQIKLNNVLDYIKIGQWVQITCDKEKKQTDGLWSIASGSVGFAVAGDGNELVVNFSGDMWVLNPHEFVALDYMAQQENHIFVTPNEHTPKNQVIIATKTVQFSQLSGLTVEAGEIGHISKNTPDFGGATVTFTNRTVTMKYGDFALLDTPQVGDAVKLKEELNDDGAIICKGDDGVVVHHYGTHYIVDFGDGVELAADFSKLQRVPSTEMVSN